MSNYQLVEHYFITPIFMSLAAVDQTSWESE